MKNNQNFLDKLDNWGDTIDSVYKDADKTDIVIKDGGIFTLILFHEEEGNKPLLINIYDSLIFTNHINIESYMQLIYNKVPEFMISCSIYYNNDDVLLDKETVETKLALKGKNLKNVVNITFNFIKHSKELKNIKLNHKDITDSYDKVLSSAFINILNDEIIKASEGRLKLK